MKSKKQQIIDFFTEHSHQEFDSDCLHRMFGPAFRSRVSEINRDTNIAVYINQTKGAVSKSVYYGTF